MGMRAVRKKITAQAIVVAVYVIDVAAAAPGNP
jgi:hypothetical protein